MRLLVAGRDPDGHQVEVLRALARSLGVAADVELLGRVDEDRLVALYREASAFVFPSLAEGFGLPVLEAMAAGLPVVASDRMAIPEAVGDAGLTVDARDVGAVAEAMMTAVHDDRVRKDLIRRGHARATSMTWSTVADQYAELFHEVARG